MRKPIPSRPPGRFARALIRDKYLYLMMLLPIAYYLIFCYLPMYGILIAFQKIKVFRNFASILSGKWIGLQYFEQFLTDPYFWQITRNTLLIQVETLIFSFPAPILFTLLLNEVRNQRFKRLVQTSTYLPHFISIVVVCGMVRSFCGSGSVISNIIGAITNSNPLLLSDPQWFRPIYIVSGIWQTFGWSSIIYLATLSSINPELYEAAIIDGAGRFRQAIHVSLPGLSTVISVQLLLQLGRILNVGYEKVLLLYNGGNMEVADVISTYVYRRGIAGGEFAYGTATGLFTSVIGFVLLVAANRVSNAINDSGLW